jgi:hypothetical protein
MDQPIELFNYSEIEEQGFRNSVEQEFLTALFANASQWSELGVTNDCCYINYWDETLMIAFDICHRNARQVLRSLKIDFTGESILMGETGTNLFDSKFSYTDLNIKTSKEIDASPSALANLAAEWLLWEFSRKIMLKEWITLFYHHKQYEMADTKMLLSWSDSHYKKRLWLGSPNRVTIVHPYNSLATLKN